MNKQELTQAIEKAKRQLSLAKEQDEKDFAEKKIARLEKELSEIEKPKEEPKKKEEPKTEKPKAEPKPEAKAQPKTTSKPKRDDDDETDCDDLEEREKTAKKYGYDLDELLAKARESKAKSAKRAKERANEPKKTPATRNKEAVSKTTERVITNVEGRAKKGNVEPREIEKLIAEYEEAISKLKKILAGLKGGKKMARGGGVEARKNPKIVRSYFEEEEFEYRRGGEVTTLPKSKVKDLLIDYVINVGVVNKVSKKKHSEFIDKLKKESYTKSEFKDLLLDYASYVGVISAISKNKHEQFINSSSSQFGVGEEYRRGGEVSSGVEKRLEELRQAIRDENISYGELAELKSLVKHIDKGDVELLEAAGVDEQDLAQYGMPIAICNRTGSFVYPTEVEGYYGYCPELDEDLYKMETTPLMARGGRAASRTTPRTTMVDKKRDKMYQAMPSGKRKSERVAEIEKKDGTSFLRKNANQYYNDKDGIYGKRREIGNRTYYESANNRADKGKFY